MKRFLLFAMTALAVFSCTKNEENLVNGGVARVESNSPHAVSYENVLESAQMAIGILEKEQPLTRSGESSRKIEDVKLISTSTLTRSSAENSANIYIVNYANNQGYAIISGDERTPSILAVVEQGHLDKLDKTIFEDKDGSEVAKSMLLSLPEYVEQQIAKSEEEVAEMEASGVSSQAETRAVSYDVWVPSNKVGPFIETKWAAGAPFNKNFPNYHCGHQVLAGCGPIAFGQLMTFYKWPMFYGNVDFDWNAMKTCTEGMSPNTYGVNMVAHLLYSFACAGDVTYNGCSSRSCSNSGYNGLGTGMTRDGVTTAIRSMKYMTDGFAAYNNSSVISTVKVGKPVLATGFGSGGHFWIIDGYSDFTRNRYLDGWLYDSQDFSLIHCNWGWAGLSNGYFTPGVFDACHPVYPDSSAITPPPSGGGHTGYDFDLLMMTVEPNRLGR